MARKSKAFKRLYQSQKRRSRQQKTQEVSKRLVDRAARGPLAIDRDRVIEAAPGELKMSEVLQEFLRPYIDLLETEEAWQKMLTLGAIAWNAALMPEFESSADKVFEDFFAGTPVVEDSQMKTDAIAILQELMDRKKQYFSEYKRLILDYALEDQGDEYRFAVISSVDL